MLSGIADSGLADSSTAWTADPKRDFRLICFLYQLKLDRRENGQDATADLIVM